MESREHFEAWFEEWFGDKPLSGWGELWCGDGYSSETIDAMWESWQASRAAIEVELPDIYGEKYTPSSVTMDGFDFEEYLTDLYAAIEQANIKVKK